MLGLSTAVTSKLTQSQYGHHKVALLFSVLAILCTWQVFVVHAWFSILLLTASALSLWGLAFIYALGTPRYLLKRDDGTMSAAGYGILAMYHLLNAALLRLSRAVSRERAIHEISPGLFLGGRLLARDRELISRSGVCSVLDLAAEFAELAELRKCGRYYSLPVLDACAPAIDQLSFGVKWVKDARRHGPVYVHCASGYGRSALFVAAYLLVVGIAENPEEAEKYIQQRRKSVSLRKCQMNVLHEWWNLQEPLAKHMD